MNTPTPQQSDTPRTDKATIMVDVADMPGGQIIKHPITPAWCPKKLERELTAARQQIAALQAVIEEMERIHSDIMDNGPQCTCGDGDEWCRRCGKSIRLSRLASSAIDAARTPQGAGKEGV